MTDITRAVTSDEVAAYLTENPDFFTAHTTLLEVLTVPHQTGEAVSLVERQASLLRERTLKLTTHLSDLIDAAYLNDAKFEKTKRMVLALLDAETLDDVAIALEESLCRDFCGDVTALVLFSDTPQDANSLRVLPRATAGVIEPLLVTNLPTCGELPAIENHFLFGAADELVASAAVIPLVKGETFGLLAIGSYEPGYFHSSQGTLFLSYVGEVLSRVVNRIMRLECGE